MPGPALTSVAPALPVMGVEMTIGLIAVRVLDGWMMSWLVVPMTTLPVPEMVSAPIPEFIMPLSVSVLPLVSIVLPELVA